MYNNFVFDFGEFSFRSLGLTVNFPEALDIRLLAPLAGILLAGDSPLEQRFNSLDKLLEQENDGFSQFTITSYATTIIHELKHFHDYITTPYGTLLMAEHMLLLRNLFLTLTLIYSEPTIVVPFQSWRTLSDSLLHIFRKQTVSGQLNNFPADSLSKITDAADEILKRIRARRGKSNTPNENPLTTSNLIEAVAIEVQETQIRALFGEEKVTKFKNYLYSIDSQGVYTNLGKFWRTIASKTSNTFLLTPTVKNALVFFSLCVPFDSEHNLHGNHPVDRFQSITTYMSRTGIPNASVIIDFFNEWAIKFKQPSFQDSLSDSVKKSKELAYGLRKLAEQENERAVAEGYGEIHPLMMFQLLDAFSEWNTAHEYMVQQILKNPLTYFNPATYIQNATLENYVAAPCYVSAPNLFKTGDELYEKWRKGGWIPIWGQAYSHNQSEEDIFVKLFYSPKQTIGKHILTTEIANTLSINVWLSYLLWSKEMLPSIHREVASLILKKINPKWEVVRL